MRSCSHRPAPHAREIFGYVSRMRAATRFDRLVWHAPFGHRGLAATHAPARPSRDARAVAVRRHRIAQTFPTLAIKRARTRRRFGAGEERRSRETLRWPMCQPSSWPIERRGTIAGSTVRTAAASPAPRCCLYLRSTRDRGLAQAVSFGGAWYSGPVRPSHFHVGRLALSPIADTSPCQSMRLSW